MTLLADNPERMIETANQRLAQLLEREPLLLSTGSGRSLEDPLWVEPGILAPPFPTFHLIKAMHMSSRCVACRQCELACPSHIPLTVLYDLIRRDIEELLGYTPGADIAIEPPVSLTLSDAPLLVEEVV